MKAAVYDVEGAPGVLKYVDIPDPVTGPDDILISVEAISIEGGDLINRRSTPPPRPSWVVGYAAAGTVVAVGANVRSRTVGDRVAAFNMQGSHAERWAVPAERTWLIPDGVDAAEAAVLPISFGTAHHCLFTRGMLRQGEIVLIQAAAGGVGLAAVQLASQAGATVIAVASGTQRRSRLLELGADHVVDRAANNVVDSVRQFTHGTGVDLVIDPVGTTLPASLSVLAPEGRLVFVGNAGGGSLTVDLWPPMQSNQTLMGVFMGPLFERPGVRASVGDMLQAVAAGRIRVVIDRIFPLADAAAAHEFAETAKPLGRIVMKP
ncbi:Quinone oxidoreductase 1 [Serratia quinivorans]|jgi:NADPH:quinone reductase-like Zn-dependent oxidoreductase|uniref:quinone oxidoreductase family protein n=1 Tax=Serratia TaxID=613 RepID=UPI00217A02B7|nr:zinc-binding alcohol dehydrogenase family protein [Serratia quinivorans]CAI0724178.1 Quinone oxidoreductase 1 [Serratia quinivorans]CAI0748141.1 Quinone oxidoreductase 1 [Serratia quinivorans]CAI0777627.1 Quinone oxidoreductase 1 [Serratia quinivorans]CAI0886637.1 Quinone oxidoreductase 1 [Serratia quinivorans]CAI0903847.1 Quinone oxidoreductase 1 [Serratia quinivorans]